MGILLVLELITLLWYFKCWDYIRNEGFQYLKNELDKSTIFDESKDRLELSNNSPLKGGYIYTTYISRIFPYILVSYDNHYYGILVFTKEYYLIKKRFDELKKLHRKNKVNSRVKFNSFLF